MNRRWRLGVPLTFLVTLHLATLFGEFLAPNSALEQNRDLPWAPPTKLHFVDTEGRFHWRPFVYPLVGNVGNTDGLSEDHSRRSKLLFLVRGEEYRLLGIFSTTIHLVGVQAPAKLYLLGTDGLGRDVLARTLIGGRTSLFAGLIAASIALTTAMLIGGIAGYTGGTVDALLMRAADLCLALPWLYLLLAARAFLPLSVSAITSFGIIVAVVGLLGWAPPARLIRGMVLTAREQPFVLAARGFGSTDSHLLLRHILPQARSLVLTQAAILVPSYVLAEITLSFLGLGIAEPQPSWGNLLGELQKYHVLQSYQWMAAPAIPLLATCVSYFSLNHRASST